jgi:hypothetical protein
VRFMIGREGFQYSSVPGGDEALIKLKVLPGPICNQVFGPAMRNLVRDYVDHGTVPSQEARSPEVIHEFSSSLKGKSILTLNRHFPQVSASHIR